MSGAIADAGPRLVRVRAAGLTAYLLPGELRSIRRGEDELVRRIHVAVRDRAWGTIPPAAPAVTTRRTKAGHVVEQRGRCHADGLDLDLEVTAAARGDGAFELAVTATARADTTYNRIGICVLLPTTLAGAGYRAAGPSGTSAGRLPRLVAPQRIEAEGRIHALFPPFTDLSLRAAGTTLRLAFGGDEFEMEDQRNWSDATFKVYSTPLALGFPHVLEAGRTLRQSVVVTAPA